MKQQVLTLANLISQIGGKLLDDQGGDVAIHGVAPLDAAGPEQLSFLTNPKYAVMAKSSQAAALLLKDAIPGLNCPQWLHDNPYAAMAKVSLHFHKLEHSFQGQHPSAYIHPEASVAPDATIYPFVFIDRGARVGSGAILYPHVVIGARASVGERSVLFSHVTLMYDCVIGRDCIIHASCVIGADGFGFAPSHEGNIKIPQIARAILEDEVELQAGCTIDRGAFQDTVIGRGSKLDDQVLIAHGVQLGEHCLIAGQGAIAGSTKIGNRFIMAGCGAVGPSLHITSNVIAGPKIGINADISDSGEYIGFPAVSGKEWRKQVIAIKQLPEMMKTIKELRAKVAALETELSKRP